MNQLTQHIIGAAIRVHREFGPGLLESTYAACLNMELRARKLRIESQVALPVVYHGLRLDVGYRIDMIVEDSVVVEIKAVESLAPIHRAQVLTYLKLRRCPVGLLLNFNVPVLKDGIVRIVNASLARTLGMRPHCLLRFASVYFVPPFVNSVTSVTSVRTAY